MDALEAELQELKKNPPSQDKNKSAAGQAEAPKPAGQQEDEEKRKKLEEEFRKALGPPENKPAPAQNSPFIPAAPPSGSAFKLIDLAFDILAVGGTSSASEAEMRDLEAGGHDPKNRGFTMQNVELTFAGVVDPYLRGDANIVLQIDPNGDTTIELEEAYLTTLEFPYNLQLKAGQYFSQFGRLNATHPHTWDFVDQPVINSRLLGEDGFRGPGGQLSWLTPLPFFAELTGSVQNAQGGTAKSFR
ncbi:MAG TPA: zinc-regulated TonB-dependent outer membrane receptor, partial [Planctomycetota bacterium]|nr:zinc-regulated TonB-dependent outer membrane receptor [Planctomycetota bacterium]